MNYRKRIVMITLLTSALLVGLNVAIFPINAQARPTIFVAPKDNVFSTETTVVGEPFTVSVNTSGWEDPGLYGYEFKLFFDPTLLNTTKDDVEYPDGHFMDWTDNFPTPVIINYLDGYILLGGILLGDVPGSTGDGIFATITFTIIAAPPTARSVSCDLSISNISFLDPDGNSITDYDVEHGYYEFAAPRPPLPYLQVLPESVSAEAAGDEVVVDITIQELVTDWKAVGFQWKLSFNATILEVLGDIAEGDFVKQFGETFFTAVIEEDYVVSMTLYVEIFEDPNAPFPEGSGTLATITFNATYEPTIVDMVASCDLKLSDVLLVDVDGLVIDTRPHEDGFYSISIAPPPWLSVEPKEYIASELGEEFDLTVFVNELAADWKMVASEFKIRYNLTMLELTNIDEGGFMKHFAMLSGASEPYTWFQFYVEEDIVSGFGVVGVIILPLDNGTWPGPFPDTTDYGAPGDLAIATFKSIYQHDELELTSDIYLDEVVLVNTAALKIPYDITQTAEEGICKYTITRAIPPFAGVLDLMTQYPSPWSGEGLNAASDAFPPQGVVELRGMATYQGDVVSGKPVSYAIISPSGETYYATAFTEADGIAVFEYSLPASEADFGLWTVKASVDLAGTVISDTLYFLMGWLVEVAEIEAPATAYKGETMGTNVSLTRICMQDPRDIMDMLLVDLKGEPITDNDLLLYITVTDELKQPVATQLLNTSMITESGFSQEELKSFVQTVGAQWMDRITIIRAQYPELVSVVANGIGISPAAFSGEATIHVNLLTDFPGVAYCPEGLETVWIQKRT